MQLIKAEQQYLRQRKPFEGLAWRIGSDGIPCCLIKVPSQIPFDRFSLILDSFELLSLSGSVILHYGVSSYYYDLVKSNLIYVFELSGEDERQLLQLISQGKYINVYGYSEKGLTFLGSKQVELKQKLCDSLEGILRNSKISVGRQQSVKTQKSDSKQVTLETQGVFVPLQPDKLLLYPLIERCRYQLQRDIQQQLSSQTMEITRQVF